MEVIDDLKVGLYQLYKKKSREGYSSLQTFSKYVKLVFYFCKHIFSYYVNFRDS